MDGRSSGGWRSNSGLPGNCLAMRPTTSSLVQINVYCFNGILRPSSSACRLFSLLCFPLLCLSACFSLASEFSWCPVLFVCFCVCLCVCLVSLGTWYFRVCFFQDFGASVQLDHTASTTGPQHRWERWDLPLTACGPRNGW